jgi:hypothetical protein
MPDEFQGELGVQDLGIAVKQSEINLIRKVYWSLFRLVEPTVAKNVNYLEGGASTEGLSEEDCVKKILYENFLGGDYRKNTILELFEELDALGGSPLDR